MTDCLAGGPSYDRTAGVTDCVEPAGRVCSTGVHPVAREVESRALGSDFGADGYATRTEVDELGRILGLGPDQWLLDVGAGQGWPGLYLARETGCTVVVTDVPFAGPAAAARRADREGIGARAWSLVTRGERLPLRAASFDAVTHTDVLCCLGPKLATLQATHEVLRPGGRTAFSVIFPTPGLPEVHARRAMEAGPPDCGLEATYPNLLRSAGFTDIEEHDVTPEYLATARRKLEETERFADAMADILGRQELDETQAKRRLATAAITDGLLRRAWFTARRPRATHQPTRPPHAVARWATGCHRPPGCAADPDPSAAMAPDR